MKLSEHDKLLRQHIYLLSGWSFSPHVWDRLHDEWPASRQKLTLLEWPTLEAPDKVGGITDYAQSLNRNIKRNSILIGWSFGGLIALKMANLFPEHCAALALIACAPCFSQKPGWRYGLRRADHRLMRRHLHQDSDLARHQFCRLVATGDVSVHETCKVLDNAYCNSKISVLQHALDCLFQADLRVELATLSCPVIFFLGEHDALVDRNIESAIQTLNPKASIVVIKNAGHAPHVSKPSEMVSRIIHFLNQSYAN